MYHVSLFININILPLSLPSGLCSFLYFLSLGWLQCCTHKVGPCGPEKNYYVGCLQPTGLGMFDPKNQVKGMRKYFHSFFIYSMIQYQNTIIYFFLLPVFPHTDSILVTELPVLFVPEDTFFCLWLSCRLNITYFNIPQSFTYYWLNTFSHLLPCMNLLFTIKIK